MGSSKNAEKFRIHDNKSSMDIACKTYKILGIFFRKWQRKIPKAELHSSIEYGTQNLFLL